MEARSHAVEGKLLHSGRLLPCYRKLEESENATQHSSLLYKSVNGDKKSFITLSLVGHHVSMMLKQVVIKKKVAGINVIKLFSFLVR